MCTLYITIIKPAVEANIVSSILVIVLVQHQSKISNKSQSDERVFVSGQ